MFLDDASSEISANCVVRLSHADPSAPITTGTIIKFFRFHHFFNFGLRVLIFGYLVVCYTYHIIILWDCEVNQLCCSFCGIQFKILGLFNFIILSVRSGVSQYIFTPPLVVVGRGTWCNHNLHTLNTLSRNISHCRYAPIFSCLYRYSVPHNISHPLTMCIIVSSCFWNILHILEPPWFRIFAFIVLVARSCSCAAHISGLVSNCRFADCKHLCFISILTEARLDCCLKNFPWIFMLSNPFSWS